MVMKGGCLALAEAVAPCAGEGKRRDFLLLAPHLHPSSAFLAPGVGSMGRSAGDGVDRAGPGCPLAEEEVAAEAEEEGMALL